MANGSIQYEYKKALFAKDAPKIKLSWEATSRSVKDNTTTISWIYQLYLVQATKLTTKSIITFDGQQYTDTHEQQSFAAGWNTLKTGTTIIQHNPDGAKSFSYSFQENYDAVKPSASGTGSLDAIPRAAVINSATEFNDEQNPTITYTNSYGEQVDKLTLAIFVANELVGVRENLPRTGTSYTFELNDTERGRLRSAIPNTSFSTAKFQLATTVGDTALTTSITQDVNITNGSPTINPVIEDINATTVALTGNKNVMVRYASNAQITYNAQAKKSAYITTRWYQCGSNQKYIDDREQDTVIIEGVESNTFFLRVYDSRNNSVAAAPTKTLIPYVKLTANVKNSTISAAGNIDITVSGKYFNGSFGAKNNSMEIEYAVKLGDTFITNPSGSGWQPLGTVSPTMDGDDYTYTFTISGLNYTKSYELLVNVIDEVSPTLTVAKTLVAQPIFDWDRDDFRHHTDVIMTDNKTIRGRQSDGADVQLMGVNGDNIVLGWGAYDNKKGDTLLCGNNIKLNMNEKLYINGREYGREKVLWSVSRGNQMGDGQVITLSESVYKQPNGIVLIFSGYDLANQGAQDVGWSTHFVPRKMPDYAGINEGQCFLLGYNSGFGLIGAKYLYIDDTTIKGHVSNTQYGTGASNIKFDNRQFCLRYVLGV